MREEIMNFVELSRPAPKNNDGTDSGEQRFLLDLVTGWEIYDRGGDAAQWTNYVLARNLECSQTYEELRALYLKPEQDVVISGAGESIMDEELKSLLHDVETTLQNIGKSTKQHDILMRGYIADLGASFEFLLDKLQENN